jgi:hypothetical protein
VVRGRLLLAVHSVPLGDPAGPGAVPEPGFPGFVAAAGNTTAKTGWSGFGAECHGTRFRSNHFANSTEEFHGGGARQRPVLVGGGRGLEEGVEGTIHLLLLA